MSPSCVSRGIDRLIHVCLETSVSVLCADEGGEGSYNSLHTTAFSKGSQGLQDQGTVFPKHRDSGSGRRYFLCISDGSRNSCLIRAPSATNVTVQRSSLLGAEVQTRSSSYTVWRTKMSHSFILVWMYKNNSLRPKPTWGKWKSERPTTNTFPKWCYKWGLGVAEIMLIMQKFQFIMGWALVHWSGNLIIFHIRLPRRKSVLMEFL